MDLEISPDNRFVAAYTNNNQASDISPLGHSLTSFQFFGDDIDINW